MHYFISYDISQNRCRQRMAKVLTRHGCTRVKKSVFYFPEAQPREVQALASDLRQEWETGGEPGDSVFFIPVEDDSMAAIGLIGENRVLEQTKNPPKVRVF